MEKIVKNILVNNNFKLNNKINGFNYEDISYFFIKKLSIKDLKEINSVDALNRNKIYQDFLSKFKKLRDLDEYPAISKNSTLLFLIESDDITDLELYRPNILLIEEDQFFLKKNVLMFTPSSIEKIDKDISNTTLIDKLNNCALFDQYKDEGLCKDIEDYMVVIQLFIKLPFLNIDLQDNRFISLDKKLQDNLKEDYNIYLDLVGSFEEYNKLNLSDDASDESIETLLKLLENDTN